MFHVNEGVIQGISRKIDKQKSGGFVASPPRSHLYWPLNDHITKLTFLVASYSAYGAGQGT